MTAAVKKLPPPPLAPANAHVIHGARVVECDWCTCDGVPYTRIVNGSAHASTDTIHLCDACASLLERAIKRRRRARRLGRVVEPWTKGFYVRVLCGRDIARELPIAEVDVSRDEPLRVGALWYKRSELQPVDEPPPPALRKLRRGTAS